MMTIVSQPSYDRIVGVARKIVSTVSISTAHELTSGDKITLNVKPNLSVGIGTSTAVTVKRNSLTGNLQINSIGFSSTGVSTVNNTITLLAHNFETGDKVHYDADTVISGLQTGAYYVYAWSKDAIQLSETLVNANDYPPVVVSFGSTGGVSQTVTKINPRIESIKNNDLVFDLSDSSLSGYSFKVFYDQDFNNEFVSTGSTDSF